MKKQIFTAPILMTAALASIIASSLSCGKTPAGGKPGDNVNPSATEKPGTPGAGENATGTNWSTATALSATNAAGSTTAAIEGANSMTAPAPSLATNIATPEPAPTAPETKPATQVVEMPATVPEAPAKFYGGDFATNHFNLTGRSEDYFLRLRAGYQHTYHGDNNDTWYAGVKFYAYPDGVRTRAGKNAWLIPDADLEFSHQYLAKPDHNNNSGSGEGLNLRASVTWPWVHWDNHEMVRDLAAKDCACPMGRPMSFTFGPTANLGFDFLFDDGNARFARYAGGRLTVNRDGFIEYTVGATDGLRGSLRQQAVAELPLFVSRDRQVKYVLRGLWNRGDHSTPDILQGGFFVEMPLDLVAHPHEWGDLIPFGK